MLGGRAGKDGVRLFEEGEEVRFRIKVPRECYVGVWSVNDDGSIAQLFPNSREPNHRFAAGEERVVPTLAVVEAMPPINPKGIDRLWVEASTTAWDPVEGERKGPFTLFNEERNRKKWVEQRRGLRVRPDVALSEKVLPFQVEPRRNP